MVLRNASSQNDGPCLFSPHGNFGDFLMIFDDIDVKIVFVGVGKENISDASISDRWAKHRNIVFIAPVVDAFLVIDFFAKPVYKLARGPPNLILLLLFGHLCIKRQQKVLQFHVVIVRDKYVSDSAVAIESVFDVIHVELSQMESSETFHDVFLYSSGCGDDAVDHLVLGQVAYDVSHSTRRHVRCISQEDGASNFGSIGGITGLLIVSFVEGLIRESPADHVVNDLYGLMEMSGLEAHCRKALEEFFIINSLVKVVAFDACRLQLLAFEEHILNLLLNSLWRDHFGLVVHNKRIQFQTTNWITYHHQYLHYDKQSPFGILTFISYRYNKCLHKDQFDQNLSPLILLANWRSRVMMVTLLAWMAHKLVSSNRETRQASAASCRASTAELWNLSSCLNSWAISLTSLWKGSFLMRRSVDFWYFLISLRATVPGLKRWGFLTPVVTGALFLAIF